MQNTEYRSLNALITVADALDVTGAPARDVMITSLTADSRAVGPGSMFVAVRGTNVDGHRFITSACAAGARAVVCEELPAQPDPAVTWILVRSSARALGQLASQWYGNPSRQLTLVGVTGTNGKTTIATLLYEMARLQGRSAGLLSTVVNKIDDEEIPSTHTTPDPMELNELLARMVDHGCDFCAMEVSSHAAAQHRIAGLDFDGGIFTNLTRDHLDYHGTFANYLAAKQSFFDSLKPEAFALTNADDRNGAIMVQNTRARRYTYSLRGTGDFRGRVEEDRIDGMLLSLNGTPVETMFVGRFNAANLTAVYGAARLLGEPDECALRDISMLVPVNGRFQPMRSNDGVTAIIDYAHTPDALQNVLETINEVKGKGAHVITVCGAGGDRDRGKRPLMASVAAALSDTVILTSDNPRSEDPDAIIEEMMTGLDDEAKRRTLAVTDRGQAIRVAFYIAHPGDVVLVAGKGHETYQVLADRTIHFDDHEHVRRALADRHVVIYRSDR